MGMACGHIKAFSLFPFPYQRKICTEGLQGRHAVNMLERTLSLYFSSVYVCLHHNIITHTQECLTHAHRCINKGGMCSDNSLCEVKRKTCFLLLWKVKINSIVTDTNGGQAYNEDVLVVPSKIQEVSPKVSCQKVQCLVVELELSMASQGRIQDFVQGGAK